GGRSGAGGRGGAGARGAGGDAATASDEAQAGERPSARQERVYQCLPPFDASSLKVLYESNTRMSNHRFSPDMQILFLSERAGQNTIEHAVYLDESAQRYTLS